MIRKTLFWFHLVVGLAAGVVVFVLCITGALLAFEKQITDWAERDVRARPPAGAAELQSPEVLLASAAQIEASPAAFIEWSADAGMPVRIRSGGGSLILLNGYTGEVIGRGALSLRGFFRWTTDLHVSLLMKLAGTWIVDVSNVGVVLLVFSGLYVWWPRHWRWKALRNSLVVRLDVRGKARDWNWHNALGFWFLAPLLFMSASGLVLSFAPVDKYWRIWAADHLLASPISSVPLTRPGTLPTSSPSWSDLMRTVQGQYPGWRSIKLNNPSQLATRSDVVLQVNLGRQGQRTQSYTVTLERAGNTLLKTSGWVEIDSGSRARAIARVGHTGEILGSWGQVVAFSGCLAGVVLVYTGFALSWRRFFVRRGRIHS